MPSAKLNKILLIEDEADIQTIVRFALEKRDKFKVKYCSSGKEALEQAEAFSPDLILLDVMMPGMDGIETFLLLRKIPSLTDAPVIFMTAKIQANEVTQYKKLGALDVITKPFNIKELADTLRGFWEKHQNENGY